LAKEILHNEKIKKQFYLRDAVTVAKELLGKIFVYNSPEGLMAARIVETEAYIGEADEAAHSYKGISERNKVMFKEGGLLYVYFIYGVHFCCNVVTGAEGKGDACLLRAMEPVAGINMLALNRYGKEKMTEREKINLLNGPGKICRAFNIDKRLNGIDLTGNTLYILDADKINKNEISAGKRVGISKSKDLLWRYYIKNSKYISKK
jgi:DNA-3-methyladenine glycosylase